MNEDTLHHTIIGLAVGRTKTAFVEGKAEAQSLQRSEVLAEVTSLFAETFPQLAVIIEQTIARAS